MPNRILKESICLSDNLDTLSPQAEVFFYRLLVHCDDYGRMDARSAVLRSKCFPLKLESVTENDVKQWLSDLREANLIKTYFVDGKVYLQYVTWERHQQIRAKRSKYPEPDTKREDMKSFDNNGNQLITNVPVIQSNPIRIQSESESNPRKQVSTPDNPINTPNNAVSMTENLIKPVRKPISVKRKTPQNNIPDWINEKTWDSFIEMRKKNRASPTGRAVELILKELEKLRAAGHDPNEVLEQSIMNNYKGVFPLKGGNHTKPMTKPAAPNRGLTILE